MVPLIIFVAVIVILAVVAHYLITYFNLPEPVRIVVGILLLLAVVLYAFGGLPGIPPPAWR
jgi:tellurite resistance protein TehA-like permease